jgi:hypothetical protein
MLTDRQARIHSKQTQTQRASEGRRKAMEWARQVGFPERQLTFAASSAEFLRAFTKRPVTKAMVLEQMHGAFPTLFGEQS